jgi:hypothetical protein
METQMQKLMVWIMGAAMFLGGAMCAQDISGNWQGTQLGLKFEATKAKASVIVIDHVEKPSGN